MKLKDYAQTTIQTEEKTKEGKNKTSEKTNTIKPQEKIEAQSQIQQISEQNNKIQIKNYSRPDQVSQTNSGIKLQRVEWFDDRFYYCQFPDGESFWYPSSNHVLGIIHNKYLQRWRDEVGAEEANRRMKEAGERGTRIHHACEILTNGGIVVFNSYHNPMYSKSEINALIEQYENNGGIAIMERQEEYWQVLKFAEFIKRVKPKILQTEMMVCSRTYGYAGTLDYLFHIPKGTYEIAGRYPLELEEGIYIADLKSSNSLHESYNLQIASYMFAYEEMYPEMAGKIIGGLIIHTNAQTKYGIEGLTTNFRTRQQMKEDFEVFLSALKVWKWNNPTESPIIRDMPSVISLQQL